MGQAKKNDFVGYFLKRKDIFNISVIDLLRELNSHLFEAKIMKLAIQHFQEKKLSVFDSSVGDWKCQTRTSMIIDLIKNSKLLKSEFSQELNIINNLILNIENLLHTINKLNSIERQKFGKQDLQTLSLQEYLKKQQIDYNPSEKIALLCLCFLTTSQNTKLPIFAHYQISNHKFKAIINLAKASLCHLSIKYEQKLAELYGSQDEQKTLNQIETKNVQKMTSLYAGFKSIFKKMKSMQQPFITHEILICECGGIQTIQNKFFAPSNNEFIKTAMPTDLDKEVTVIEVYQFPGSLEKLQAILEIPDFKTDIPKEFYRPCQCFQPTQQQPIESIELAIMAFFAQHPQFTNGAAIDWEGLGLSDSDLKKEYDALCALPGHSRNDMSKLWINHMYPSTIRHVLVSTKDITSLTSDPNFCGLSPDCLK